MTLKEALKRILIKRASQYPQSEVSSPKNTPVDKNNIQKSIAVKKKKDDAYRKNLGCPPPEMLKKAVMQLLRESLNG